MTLRWLMPFLLSGAQATCAATGVSVTNGPLDCVGRTQVALPDDFDVASNSVSMILGEYRQGSVQPRFEFEDGESAGFSSQYYRGRMFVSPALDHASSDLILQAAMNESGRARDYATTTRKDPSTNAPLTYGKIDLSPLQGFASHVNAATSATMLVGDHAVVFNSSGRGYEKTYTWAEAQPSFEALLQGIAPRPLKTVPHKPGVCMPHIFIEDDGNELRSISTTYRLKSHPDVTVVVEDSNPAAVAPGMDPEKFTARHANEFFWSQDYQADKRSVRMLWLTLHPVQLAGLKGESSFVELTRQDGTIDYGYFAATRSDAAKDEGPTRLRLHVIRKAKIASAKGLQSMGKDDFLKLSESIAASLRPHPIDGH